MIFTVARRAAERASPAQNRAAAVKRAFELVARLAGRRYRQCPDVASPVRRHGRAGMEIPSARHAPVVHGGGNERGVELIVREKVPRASGATPSARVLRGVYDGRLRVQVFAAAAREVRGVIARLLVLDSARVGVWIERVLLPTLGFAAKSKGACGDDGRKVADSDVGAEDDGRSDCRRWRKERFGARPGYVLGTAAKRRRRASRTGISRRRPRR